jgi:hypothetical protein
MSTAVDPRSIAIPPSNIPIPDPSSRTDALVDNSIRALREVIEERFRGMDKAIDLVAQAANKLPSAAQIDIANLRELQNEKFNSLINRIKEGDERASRIEKDTASAVKTAFDAANLATSKTEAGVNRIEAFLTKQIDQIFAQGMTNANRIQVLESTKEGSKEVRTGMSSTVAIILTAMGVATAILVAVLSFIHTNTSVALPPVTQAQITPH